MSNLDKLWTAARAAAQYETNELGSPWCSICHRAAHECDKAPKDHPYGPTGPCAGFELRRALRGYGIELSRNPYFDSGNSGL